MQSKKTLIDGGVHFEMAVTLARTSCKPTGADNPHSAQPHPTHPLWDLDNIRDVDTLDGLDWQIWATQEDGSLLKLPRAKRSLENSTYRFESTSGRHKAAGAYRDFLIFDREGGTIFHHPIDVPLQVAQGERLSLTFVVHVVREVTAENVGVGAVAEVVALPPKMVETEDDDAAV